MTTERTTTTEIVVAEKVTAKLPAITALIFGAFLLFGAAFAQSSHNAAHDSRHAIAVPCH